MVRKALAALVLVALACGKRGDPRPPVPVIPQATGDLSVTQRADQVVLSWSYPSLTTAGRNLTEIRRIAIYRYVEDLPVNALTRDPNVVETTEVNPDAPRALSQFANIPTLSTPQFTRLSQRIDTIESDSLAAATTGARLVYADTPPFRTEDGRPVRVTYAVVTEGASARSEISNLAIIVPLLVAVPPPGLTAEARAEGVVLNWQRPATSIRGAEAPVIEGYHVYRTAPGETVTQFSAPINNAPVRGTTYTDTPSYGEHEYRVSAVATSGPPMVQSNLSEPVRVMFRDLVPPPVPQNLTPLLETRHVRLLWDAVEAPDLAGYLVYRIEGRYRLKLSPNPVRETNFTDISLDIGIGYQYEVTSIDTSGNESAPVRSETVIVPKTP